MELNVQHLIIMITIFKRVRTRKLEVSKLDKTIKKKKKQYKVMNIKKEFIKIRGFKIYIIIIYNDNNTFCEG